MRKVFRSKRHAATPRPSSPPYDVIDVPSVGRIRAQRLADLEVGDCIEIDADGKETPVTTGSSFADDPEENDPAGGPPATA